MNRTHDAADKGVAFVDSSLAGYHDIIATMPVGIEVVVLDAARDGLTQMAEWAAGHAGYSSIHLISHGAPGSFQIGQTTTDAASLQRQDTQDNLRKIGGALAEDGDFLIYGCSVGADQHGADFIYRLQELTGADIAASQNLTGSKALGGDWVLERAEAVESQVLAFEGYSFALPSYTMTSSTTLTLTNGVQDLLYIPNGFYAAAVAMRTGHSACPILP